MYALLCSNLMNSSWNQGYKQLAKKAVSRECCIAENPISTVIIDVRSKLFRYIRLYVVNRQLHSKIKCVFGLLNDIKQQIYIILELALVQIKHECELLNVKQRTYVFPYKQKCPFKKEFTKAHIQQSKDSYSKLLEHLEKFRSNVFDIKLLVECHSAFEGFLLSNIENVCLLYNNITITNIIKNEDICSNYPDTCYYESDRLCAELCTNSSAILSEDYDCVALFGAEMMITDVWPSFFSYTVLSDIMSTFKSTTRENLIYKCCILGTSYNRGLKGIGPVKVLKLQDDQLVQKFEHCMELQSIDSTDILKFYYVTY